MWLDKRNSCVLLQRARVCSCTHKAPILPRATCTGWNPQEQQAGAGYIVKNLKIWSLKALFNLPVFCPVEMIACFYTFIQKPPLPSYLQDLIFRVLKKTWDSLRKKTRPFHHTSIQQKEKSAEQPLIKWKKYIRQQILIKIKTISSDESSMHKTLFHNSGISVSPLSLLIILLFLLLFFFSCCIISGKTWTTNHHVYLIHSPLVLKFGISSLTKPSHLDVPGGLSDYIWGHWSHVGDLQVLRQLFSFTYLYTLKRITDLAVLIYCEVFM